MRAMEWHRAGGKAPPKESWGSWIKRGTKAVTAVAYTDPLGSTAIKPAEGVPPSTRSKSPRSGASAPQKEFATAFAALQTKLRGDVPAGQVLAQLSRAWEAREAACAQRISELNDALSAAREKSNADEARLDQLFASAAADKKRLAELEKATSSKAAADIF